MFLAGPLVCVVALLAIARYPLHRALVARLTARPPA